MGGSLIEMTVISVLDTIGRTVIDVNWFVGRHRESQEDPLAMHLPRSQLRME